jgi:hypothetical protein
MTIGFADYNGRANGEAAMAGVVSTIHLADLTPVAAEAGPAEGDPRPVYTWAGPSGSRLSLVSSYPPSDGGAAPPGGQSRSR